MTIGEQIRYIRVRRGLTQNQLAMVTKIHPVTIRKYETNKLHPKKEQIKKIAANLAVNPLVFQGVDPAHTPIATAGDLLCLMMMLYKSDVLTTDENYSEVRIAPFMDHYLSYSLDGEQSSPSSGAFHLLIEQAEKSFLKWAKVYDGHKKNLAKYGHMDEYKQYLQENENQLQIIEMELAMIPDYLLRF